MDFRFPRPSVLHQFEPSLLREPDPISNFHKSHNFKFIILGVFAIILGVFAIILVAAALIYTGNQGYAEGEQPQIDAQIWAVENDMGGAKIHCDRSIRQHLNDVQCRVTKDGKEVLLSCDRSRPNGARCQRDDGSKVIIIGYDTHFSHPLSPSPFPR